MRAVTLVATAFIALALGASTARAADPVIVDVLTDQPDVVTVGDRIHYTIILEVDHATSVALATAAFPPEVALVDTPETTTLTLVGERDQVTLSFDIAPFRPGRIDLPPIPLRYSRPDGASGVLETPGSVILVSSVLPVDGDLTPRDLKPQAEVGTPPPAWVLPALGGAVGALVLLIVGLLVRRSILKRRAIRASYRPPVVHGPEDVARETLDRTGLDFANDGDLAAYYTSLGNTVRQYLSERYGFPAFALTTSELEDAMLARGLDRWQVRVASGLLEQCDAVVYARYQPAAERADADLTAAYEIVEMSRPEERPIQAPEEVEVS